MQTKIYLIIVSNISLSLLQITVFEISLLFDSEIDIVTIVERSASESAVDCAILSRFWQISVLLSEDLQSELYILKK